MQCPYCYKDDLHPKATRCHHCGGEIDQSPEWLQMLQGVGGLLFIGAGIVAAIYLWYNRSQINW